jgi:glycosyltransferase involved in cell wall biosynthesis
MRIGMMTDTYKPYISGVTNYIDLNKGVLEDAGHEVYVFTFGELDYQDSDPRVIRTPGMQVGDTGFYLSLRYTPQARKLLQTMDVVHVHHPFLSGRLALRYCRTRQIPIIYTNHTRYDMYAHARIPIIPEELAQSVLQAYMPHFCEAVDLVISPSEGMKKVMRELKVEAPIEVVPNGVDLKRFYTAKPHSRADFGYNEKDILLIYAGRIAPEKNLEFLLQSFAGVSHVVPDAHLLILGSGQKEHEDATFPIPEKLGIPDRVRFFGLIDYNELPSYLAMCDAFVTASVTEVHPLSVIEAMGTGLPVVGIDSPGVGDSVTDGVSGLLAPTEDIASFTAKLTQLCLNKALRNKMRLAAREASKQYDLKRTAKIMLKHYDRLKKNARPIKKRSLDERLMSILRDSLK